MIFTFSFKLPRVGEYPIFSFPLWSSTHTSYAYSTLKKSTLVEQVQACSSSFYSSHPLDISCRGDPTIIIIFMLEVSLKVKDVLFLGYGGGSKSLYRSSFFLILLQDFDPYFFWIILEAKFLQIANIPWVTIGLIYSKIEGSSSTRENSLSSP